MALVIELERDGTVSDGYETWWDDVEAAIAKSPSEFPVLSRIDPYDTVVITGDDLKRMVGELDALIGTTVDRRLIDSLVGLCEKALAIDKARLVFRGD